MYTPFGIKPLTKIWPLIQQRFKTRKTDKIDAAVTMQFIKLHNDKLKKW